MNSPFMFKLVGFFACLVRGKLHLYNFLKAQAELETGNYTSGHFRNGYNAFGLHYPMPRANGFTDIDAEGKVATFSGWWDCWMERLDWDKRHGVDNYANLEQYAAMVQVTGYNPSPLYAAAWLGQYQESFSWYQTIWFDMPVDGSGMFRRWLWIILLPTLIVLLYLLLRWLWRKYKPRSRR